MSSKLVIYTKRGALTFEGEFLANLAGVALLSCRDEIEVDARNIRDDLASLFKYENLSKGIEVKDTDHGLVIKVNVIVKYGISIKNASYKAINEIKQTFNEVVGVDVKVNIRVTGIKISE